ncbi:hypothetical protein EMPS_04525 [Entomortierella parvispora]|uniref:Annexin n=1 Tax=Entomortierella parvispora TaxID=205924 RepID=A0A9P3H9C1_9FUNG|nr:hypothetical protein EMPS_04525 [Entomortierella parvispora]
MTPAVPPEVAYDVQNIHSALESTVPDHQALVNIIGRREYQQLLVIARQYRVSYGVDLPSELDKRIIGSVGSLLAHACQHKVLAEVFYLSTAGKTNRTYESLRKKDSPIKVFCEILLGRTSEELRELSEAFTAVQKSDLKQHILAHCPDDVLKTFFSAVIQDKEDKALENKEGAIENLNKLLQAQDVPALLNLAASLTTAQLCDLVRSYNAHYLTSHVVTTIQKTFKHKGEHVEVLLFAVMQAADPARHVSLLLEESMAGLGTNEDQLSRLVIRNRGKFMEKVKAAFHVDYGRTLADRVRGDTSGLYSHLICHLINQTI